MYSLLKRPTFWLALALVNIMAAAQQAYLHNTFWAIFSSVVAIVCAWQIDLTSGNLDETSKPEGE